ncbi:hypothetical protein FKM82_030079 [Ascaphus truei]
MTTLQFTNRLICRFLRRPVSSGSTTSVILGGQQLNRLDDIEKPRCLQDRPDFGLPHQKLRSVEKIQQVLKRRTADVVQSHHLCPRVLAQARVEVAASHGQHHFVHGKFFAFHHDDKVAEGRLPLTVVVQILQQVFAVVQGT